MRRERESTTDPVESSGFVTSTGKIGTVEKRSYDRKYLSKDACFSDFKKFDEQWSSLNCEGNDSLFPNEVPRRIVFRTFVTEDVLNEILDKYVGTDKSDTQVETLYKMSDIDSVAKNEYLIILAKNNHQSEINNFEKNRIEKFTSAEQLISPPALEKYSSLPEGLSLTFAICPQDYESLELLWRDNFEWTTEGIKTLAATQGETTWFCGVRNKAGELVAASMAEAVIFRDRWLTELTEWAAEVKGVSSVMVSGLICRVLDALYYGTKNSTPLLVAEMNLHHERHSNLGAPGTGRSVGLSSLKIPNTQRFNTLRHNVLVGSGREGQGNTKYNNFIFGALSQKIISSLYPENEGKKVVENVQNTDSQRR